MRRERERGEGEGNKVVIHCTEGRRTEYKRRWHVSHAAYFLSLLLRYFTRLCDCCPCVTLTMASRTASRAVLRSSFRPTTTARFALPVRGLRVTRGFASEAKSPPQDTKSAPGSGNAGSPGSPGSPGKSSNGLLWAALAIAGAGGYFYLKGGDPVTSKDFTPTQKDYQKVYDAIAHKLADETDYDDGSYGPVSPPSLSLSLQ